MIPPYPLAWPDAQKRSEKRVKSQFRTTLGGAIRNVMKSLQAFASDSARKIEDVQITSNVGLTDDKPSDPGIAVWFHWDGALRCIAVDRYLTPAENLQALHHVIEARRTELRHAGIEMVRTTFRGHVAALPAPDSKPWHLVVGCDPNATPAEISAAYKLRARELGQRSDEAQMQELNIARDKGIALNG